ncbi:MAG: segregation/condensation protein A [Pirellulaceae bacterium]|jgi:segregation and condensation protein A|nr:segregation/condensation protein A [Pirellulaceae bacterium]
MNFRVETSDFRGPIDLLLFLVRRNEIDISGVGLSTIVDQYLEYLEVLKEIDINSVGDFLNVASRLVEMKAKQLLPAEESINPEEVYEDPRQDLVQRLMLYKNFREAAVLLDERAAAWHQRYARIQDDLPPRTVDLADQPIRTVELWDLVSAFGRVLRDNRRAQPEKVYYDETPITFYMKEIHRQLQERRQVVFSDLFKPGMHKSAMIGVFLAVLELTRHHNVRAEQDDPNGDIVVVPGEGFTAELQLHSVEDYNPHLKGISSSDPDSFEA